MSLADLLTGLGIDPSALGGGGPATSPFAADTGKMSLWKGSTLDPKYYQTKGLPDKPGATKVYSMVWGGKTVAIHAPDFGPDVHIAINSTIGENPSADDIRKAPGTRQVRIWIELRGKDNRPLYQQDINTGSPGEGNTEMLLGRAGTYMKQKGSPDVLVNINPYDDPRGTLIGGDRVDQTGTIEDELKGLYNMKPAEIKKYKTQLWLAGYYGRDTPLDQINMTVLSGDDIRFFSDVMLQAARYFAAGKKTTWQDLLAQQSQDPSNTKTKGTGAPISISDPAAITAAANKTGQQLLGRAPSPKDVQTLIAAIQQKETIVGTAVNEAQAANTNTPIASVDPQSEIDQYFREQYPAETMAVDWGAAAADWEQMLRTPAGQPGVVTPHARNV